jgi:hypothetical protein
MSCIYCDGACNKITKNEGWGSVTDQFGNDLIKENMELLTEFEIREEKTNRGNFYVIISKFNDVKSQQNNGAKLQ